MTACSSETPHYAPVTDIATIEHIPKNGTYRVASGETLYSIAWRYGLDYRYLASLNHIPPPFHVVAGQRIYLNHQSEHIAKIQSPKVVSHPVPVLMVEHDSNVPVKSWYWPAQGPIIQSYSSFNKGINIGGHFGTAVYATAQGIVVYSGNGIRGYGNLIIIKHNSTYLSAYAYNSALWVKEGQRVESASKNRVERCSRNSSILELRTGPVSRLIHRIIFEKQSRDR